MEGKDSVFGNALESIEKNIAQQEADEAKKNSKAQDPLKAGKPKELKGAGAKDNKLQKLEAKASKAQDPLKAGKPKELKAKNSKDGKLTKMEGIEPDENTDDEGKKIQKLTEEELDEKETNITTDVKELVQKAKDAVDGGNYEEAQNLVSRLAQIQSAVKEPEEVTEPVSEPVPDSTSEEAYESFIQNDKLQEMIDSALDTGVEFKLDEAKKKDSKAALRNRGDVVLPANSPKVTDEKDHFPINNQNQARNALARVNQYKESPKWYKGDLDSLVRSVAKAVQKKYKDIKVSKAAKTPGKG